MPPSNSRSAATKTGSAQNLSVLEYGVLEDNDFSAFELVPLPAFKGSTYKSNFLSFLTAKANLESETASLPTELQIRTIL